MTFIPPPNWYDPAWKCVAMVTIDHTKVGGGTETQSDFPVLICGDQITDNRFWYRVLSTGADIVVTLDDGVTKLKRELVSISKTSKTMELYVRVPSLSHLVDPILYIYFHNPAGAETNDLDTWDSNFAGVWHMGDGADTSHINDSTANAYTGTKTGAANPAVAVGVFAGDNAQSFNGATSYITMGDVLDIDYNLPDTIEVIASITDVTLGGHLVAKSDHDEVPGCYVLSHNTNLVQSNIIQTWSSKTLYRRSTATLSNGTWCHIARRYDGSNTLAGLLLYKDGQLLGTGYSIGNPLDASVVNAYPLCFGAAEALAGFFKGSISEVRISKTSRSVGWTSTTYASLIGYATFLTVEFGTTYWEYTATAAERTDYQIELRDKDGILLFMVDDFDEGTLTQEVNNPATVSFHCPISDQIADMISYLDHPNTVWVWRDDELMFAGPVSITELTHGVGEGVQVDAQDYMVQLKGELVTYYDADDTPENHIIEFLDYQSAIVKVLVGTIEPTISRDLTIERDYIYNVLMDLRDSIGGFMYVGPDRKLNWSTSIASTTDKQLRYGKNLIGITKRTDWLNFGNRLYIYGDGCNLIDAGLSTEYIEDTASIAKYGLCVRVLYEANFSSAETMYAYAQNKINEMANPRITYQVEMVNLAEFGFTQDEINLGDWLSLIDEEIGVNVLVQVVKVVYDLRDGAKIQVELAAKGLDICDIVPGVYVL